MKYLYWISAIFVVVLGVYFSMNFRIQERSIPKIKFSQVDAPEALGKGVYERLRQEIANAPLVFLGVTPDQPEDMELWRGFLEANTAPGSKYDVIVGDPKLPYLELFRPIVHLEVQEDMPRFVEGIKNAREQGLRVAVIVPYIYSSKLVKTGPFKRLKEEFGLEFTSFSVLKFPVTREQEETFMPLCELDPGRDLIGTGHLGCMVKEIARKTYRKKFEAEKYSGMMEQSGSNDYIILLNRNPNPK